MSYQSPDSRLSEHGRRCPKNSQRPFRLSDYRYRDETRKGMNADGTGKVFDGLWCLGYVEGRLYNFPWGRSGWAIGGWVGGASEKEEIGVFSRWGGGAALIREPINATILRQSIIIFPICIATELLFKSAPPVSTPLATPCKSCPGRQRDSSSGTPYRFCYAVGFFLSRTFTFNLLAEDESGDNLRALSKSWGGLCPVSHAVCSFFCHYPEF